MAAPSTLVSGKMKKRFFLRYSSHPIHTPNQITFFSVDLTCCLILPYFLLILLDVLLVQFDFLLILSYFLLILPYFLLILLDGFLLTLISLVAFSTVHFSLSSCLCLATIIPPPAHSNHLHGLPPSSIQQGKISQNCIRSALQLALCPQPGCREIRKI